jgi:hypothetical protein
VTLETSCGPLVLRSLYAWVDEDAKDVELLVSRGVMGRLGFREDDLLVKALAEQAEWDISDVGEPAAAGTARGNKMMSRVLVDDGYDSDNGFECVTPNLPAPREDSAAEKARRAEVVFGVLEAKLRRYADEGLDPVDVGRLRDLLVRHADVLRLDLAADPPVDVKPLKVRLKDDTVPVKCSLRRYPPAHVKFLEDHVKALEAAALIYKNNRSRWAAATRVVRKKDGSLRMTIDSRPINACTEQLSWPMPNLDAAFALLVGLSAFSSWIG